MRYEVLAAWLQMSQILTSTSRSPELSISMCLNEYVACIFLLISFVTSVHIRLPYLIKQRKLGEYYEF
jgi:hypothetical protein